MTIRPCTQEDLPVLARLFYDAVNAVKDYPPEQVAAWAGRWRTLLDREREFLSACTLVAEEDGAVIGYGKLDQAGYLDHLFVRPDRWRQGVASALCDALEEWARREGAVRVTVHASIPARLFFTKRGYEVTGVNRVPIGDVALRNYSMARDL